jgi:hypothetical protein
LYQNVKRRSLQLNSFDLPEKLFGNKNWEVLQLSLSSASEKVGSMVLCYRSSHNSSGAIWPRFLHSRIFLQFK